MHIDPSGLALEVKAPTYPAWLVWGNIGFYPGAQEIALSIPSCFWGRSVPKICVILSYLLSHQLRLGAGSVSAVGLLIGASAG